MKIAIVIPSLESDIGYLKNCWKAIEDLDPEPDEVLTYQNDGSEGLKYIRSYLFDKAFNYLDCDLALQCSSDFQLWSDILDHVDEKAITTFAFMTRKKSLPLQLLKFLVSPNMWTGCYCIPRNAWEKAKDVFDGNDTSIKNWAERAHFPIKRVRSPKYYVLRPSEIMIEFVRDLPLHKKILKLGAWF
jgi:hypothetical protein